MACKVFDIHSHIVPGVDDGSLSLNMSMDMLRNAYNQGVRSIVCTSHDGYDIESYMENFKELQKQAAAENIDIKLYHGCEIYCDDDVVEEIIDKLNRGDILTLNGTKYVLIEFNPYETAKVILECVRKISLAGYTPIIAHTERHFGLSMEYTYISLLQEYGCLFQVNAYSIVNESDKTIKNFAIKLLSEKIASFIGSDAHRTNHRPYMINSGIDYIYKHCDIEYANDICYRNAQYILNLN